MSTVVRLYFVYDDDDRRWSCIKLSRTIPAPLHPIISADAFHEFCNKIDQTFVPLCRTNYAIRLALRIWYDVLLCAVLVQWILIQLQSPFTDTMRQINIYVWVMWLVFIVIPVVTCCVSPTRAASKVCSDMNLRHSELGISFQLKTATIERGDNWYKYISHIEVRIPSRYATRFSQLTRINCIRHCTKDPYRMNRIIPHPLRQRFVERDAYEAFCDKMDTLLRLLHSSTPRPQNIYLHILGFSILSALTFSISNIYRSLGSILIAEVIALRSICIYRVYKHARQCTSGIDVLRDIRQLLHNEMSCISPTISFHLKETMLIPPHITLMKQSISNDIQPCIYAYVSPLTMNGTNV